MVKSCWKPVTSEIPIIMRLNKNIVQTQYEGKKKKRGVIGSVFMGEEIVV